MVPPPGPPPPPPPGRPPRPRGGPRPPPVPARTFTGGLFVASPYPCPQLPLPPLSPRRPDVGARHATSKSLSQLPVEPARRRRRPRRPRRRLLRLDGADRRVGARGRRVGARPPLHGVLDRAREPHRGRRQPTDAHAPGRPAAGAPAVPARMAGARVS